MNSYCVRDSFLVSGMTVTCIFKNGDKIDGIIHVCNTGATGRVAWPGSWGTSRGSQKNFCREKSNFRALPAYDINGGGMASPAAEGKGGL